MDSVWPAVVALLGGSALAIVGLVPWAALQYRRRGELGLGPAVLAFLTVVYALALVTYTLLPLPDASTVEALCRTPSSPQLRPFTFLADIAKEGGLSGPLSIVTNRASAQVVFNVILFVPLGMLVRQVVLRGRFAAGVVAGGLAGLAVSLLIEFTQLTGDWFLFPCAYRLFDVDDLLANTAGALLGTVLAPVLVLLTGRRGDRDAGQPRPVTLRRRLFGMLCDALVLTLVSGALASVTALGLALLEPGVPPGLAPLVLGVLAFVAPALQLVLVLRTGRTIGEAVVRLTPSTPPALWQRLVRWALGSGGWAAALASPLPGSGTGATLLVLAALVGVLATRDRRGFASAVARLRVIDDRAAPAENAADSIDSR